MLVHSLRLLLIPALAFATGCARNDACLSGQAPCLTASAPSQQEPAREPIVDQKAHEADRVGGIDQGDEASEPFGDRIAPDDSMALQQTDREPERDREPVQELDIRVSGTGVSLEAMIKQALESNPDVHSAQERIHLADAFLAEAQAAWFPSLALAEQYGATNVPAQAFTFQLNQAQLNLNQNFNRPTVTDIFRTQVITKYNLYSGGTPTAEAQAATAERDAAVSGVKEVHNQLVFRVAEAYYRLLQATELLHVRKEAVTQVGQHVDMVQQRFRTGTAVKSDVLAVEVKLAEVQEALITARNRVDLAWMVLDNVVGTPVPRGPVPRTIPAAPWSDHVDELHLLMEEALGKRPELERLARKQEAASGRVEAAQGARFPTLDFTAQYNLFTGDLVNSNSGFFVGLIAELMLFDGGLTTSRIDQARARMRELNAQERRLLLDVELDVHRAHVRMREAGERLRVAAKATEQAEESLREFEVRYRAEAATLTELVDAQVAFSKARARHANARADLEIARADLERSAGRLAGAVGKDAGTIFSGMADSQGADRR